MLFQSGSAESLARKILELAADRDRAAVLGRCGLEAVRERYHDQLLAARTADLYARLLGNT
jgi:glycosyltransferase involved in cell wall biosynthesis